MIDKKNINQKIDFKQQFEELMRNTIIAPNDDYDTQMQSIRELIRENTPKSLFHFRAFNEFSIDAFWKDYIYHSTPKKFNDPHDCLVFVDKPLLVNVFKQYLMPQNSGNVVNQYLHSDILKEFLPKIKKIVNVPNITSKDLHSIVEASPNILYNIEEETIKLTENIEKKMYNYYKTYPKIACFSENIESTLMWSHYANSHKGFALEYDFTKEQKCLVCKETCRDFAYISLYPVIYTDTRYNATDLAVSLVLNEYLTNFGIDNHTIPDELAYIKTNIYKGMDWKYEKEWRTFLIYDRNTEREAITIKPKAIYLGANISPVHQDILIGYAKIKEMEIYKMKVDIYSDEFKLIYENI